MTRSRIAFQYGLQTELMPEKKITLLLPIHLRIASGLDRETHETTPRALCIEQNEAASACGISMVERKGLPLFGMGSVLV